MQPITKMPTREIIDDFAHEIRLRATSAAKPSKTVINFRTEEKDRFEREIVTVPVDLLRFRKDNGRIASDVMHYEKTVEPLHEIDENSQAKLREFLSNKDPEKTEQLKKNILHSGQREPAIITCDGFLINGNRRKMVMDELRDIHPNSDEFQYMNVVILPGKNEEGGPPTLFEIEKLENRYQLQSDGKSEYYGFDRALSIRRKLQIGLSLEEQIRDDPEYVNASTKELKNAIKKTQKDYLQPLECVDRYLSQFGREGQYHTISSGPHDREGRWQAFVDYSNTYEKFHDPKFILNNPVEEDEIGTIEEAAFNIIRLRDVPGIPKMKVHSLMRNLPKYCSTSEGYNHIISLADTITDSPQPTTGNHIAVKAEDDQWAAQHRTTITYHLKNAIRTYDMEREKETPLALLEAAFKKLTHNEMVLSAIAVHDYKIARKWLIKIYERADELERELYQLKKSQKLKIDRLNNK